MAVTKIKPIKGTLNKALDYIQNPEKTDGKMLVSSFGCSYETADIEFAFTLSQALDKGSNLAHHLIQAFELGEVDYQTAHEIGRQLADAVTKGQHEYVLTTHIDKCYHLQSAPLQGRNTRRSVQCRYSGGQGFSLQARWCRFQKTGQGQRRLPDSPPVCTFPRASGDRRQNARPYTVRY